MKAPEGDGSLVHHSDRGSRHVSIRYSERLSGAEMIYRRSPWKTREALGLATLEWVAWFNQACNDRICLPPETLRLRVPVGAGASI